jgi:hypothetical protein
MATFLIVVGGLVGLVALACAAFGLNGRRIAGAFGGRVAPIEQALATAGWSGVIDGKAVGDGARAPLSGRSSVWWRLVVTQPVVAEAVAAETVSLSDGTGTIRLRASAVDPHPEERRRFACAADPLAQPDQSSPRELAHGEVTDAPYVAEEYSLAPGERVAVLAVRQADGTFGAPPRGRRLYATGRAAQVAANARRGSRQMARLAAWLALAAAGLVLLGLVLQ